NLVVHQFHIFDCIVYIVFMLLAWPSLLQRSSMDIKDVRYTQDERSWLTSLLYWHRSGARANWEFDIKGIT
ncbi:hypothetical protein ACJX0J_032684, partial [Zea mays]